MRRVSLLLLGSALVACSAGTGPGGDAGHGGDGSVDLGVHVDAGPPDSGVVDMGVDAPLTMVGTCQPCTVDAECDHGQCLALSSGVHACVPQCDPMVTPTTCPRAFDCSLGPAAGDGTICVPRGDCCVDGDADGYGAGIGCMGLDCNDVNPNVHPGAQERCNGFDDDCNGLVDDAASDCGDQNCRERTDGTSEQVSPGMCVATACVPGTATSCGLFACQPPPSGVTLPQVCATTCHNAAGADDDSLCAPAAHCSAGVCVTDAPAGGACTRDGDCSGGHCGNGFCCDHGICCGVVTDCPTSIGGTITTCDDAANCQGSRGMPTCDTNICGTVSGIPDDSACDATVRANDCGLFVPVFCNGMSNQSAPPCPSTCIVAGAESDALCDPGAHCDTGACVPNVPDGHVCSENSDCINAYCNNGVCCNGSTTSATCCRAPSDCGGFGSAPRCDTPSSCQGHRDAAICSADFKCSTMTNVDDDSACGAGIMANDCGPYPALFCSGGTDQPLPMCAMMCMSDAECDANAHCDTGMCVPDLPDGRGCVQPSDCVSGYCGNGFCCAGSSGTDCCSMPSDCDPVRYGQPSSCLDPANCQGRRQDAACNASHQCQPGPMVDDDTGCGGTIANTCGNYPSVTCTSMADQPAPACPNSCVMDTDCDPTAFCNPMHVCASRGNGGDSCGMTSECNSGLTCVDGVCCSTACTGTCNACNVPGHLGTCFAIPAATDPSNECGGVSCAAYFTAPMGLVVGAQCDRRADVGAAAVSCDGSGHCQTAAMLCPSQPAGPIQVDCDDVCQTLSGCTGTTSGTCAPYTPPVNTQSCGTGACMRTTAICSGGGQVTCTPGAAAPESCNDIDDNCNGTTDEGLSSDAYEPNNSCPGYNVGNVGSVNGGGLLSSQTLMPTLYSSGDVDIFRVHFYENDSSCGCGTICGFGACTDEDYGIKATLTVPAGAGSYEVCNLQADGACGVGTCHTVAAGSSGFVWTWKDGSCCIIGSCNDEGDYWITIRPVGSPGFECSPYTLTVAGTQGCCSGTCATTTG